MRFLVTGGCGFIGSHLVASLRKNPATDVVRVVDNLCSGSRARLGAWKADPRLEVHEVDLKDSTALNAVAAKGCDHVFHFAANPDIAKAMTDPSIDFWEGTYLTQNLLEACRAAGVNRITYASGSGVYGDRSHLGPAEDDGPLEPVSTYGASKLGCESLICAYCHMFGLSASAFRFANVVGDWQTHGVTFDFVRRLRADPAQLVVMGDGTQDKSYIHVDDVVAAMITASPGASGSFEVFNVGTGDTITVARIAEIVAEEMGLANVIFHFGDDPRGWRGDVPIVKFDDDRIRSLGWQQTMTSEEAIRASIRANIQETSGP